MVSNILTKVFAVEYVSTRYSVLYVRGIVVALMFETM